MLLVGFFIDSPYKIAYNPILSHKGKVKMDTEKWKSVLVPREVYTELKSQAKLEGRTISGQLRLMFSQYQEQREQRFKQPDASKVTSA
jgi:hypothetical protein